MLSTTLPTEAVSHRPHPSWKSVPTPRTPRGGQAECKGFRYPTVSFVHPEMTRSFVLNPIPLLPWWCAPQGISTLLTLAFFPPCQHTSLILTVLVCSFMIHTWAPLALRVFYTLTESYKPSSPPPWSQCQLGRVTSPEGDMNTSGSGLQL